MRPCPTECPSAAEPMPTMSRTPRFAKDRVVQAAHPFRSARASVSDHPFYDSPGPPTRAWSDATTRPRTAPQTKERPPPVEVPHTPAALGYAGESPHAAVEVGSSTATADPRTSRLQLLDSTLAKEMKKKRTTPNPHPSPSPSPNPSPNPNPNPDSPRRRVLN